MSCVSHPLAELEQRPSAALDRRFGFPSATAERVQHREQHLAGTLAATEYLRDIGRRFGDPGGSSRREELVAGLQAIVGYERALVTRLIEGLEHIPGLTIHGITDRARFDERVPTVSVSIDGVDPRTAAETLGRQGIFVWDGDFYATGLIERLGKAETGGVLRIGLVHYNTAEEVDRTLDAIASIASSVAA